MLGTLKGKRLFPTVDGRHPAPPGMYKTLSKDGINYQPQLDSRIPEPATLFIYILLIRLFLLHTGDTLGFVPSLCPFYRTLQSLCQYHRSPSISGTQNGVHIHGIHLYKLYGYGLCKGKPTRKIALEGSVPAHDKQFIQQVFADRIVELQDLCSQSA